MRYYFLGLVQQKHPIIQKNQSFLGTFFKKLWCIQLIIKRGGFGRHFVTFACPFAQINELAPLTTKRTVWVALPLAWRLAGGAGVSDWGHWCAYAWL